MQKLIGVYYDDLEGSLSTKKAGCKIDISFATEKIHLLQKESGREIDIGYRYRKNKFAIKNQVARFKFIFAIEKSVLAETCNLIFYIIFYFSRFYFAVV